MLSKSFMPLYSYSLSRNQLAECKNRESMKFKYCLKMRLHLKIQDNLLKEMRRVFLLVNW